MNILWLSWKDAEHPLAGGAEVVSAELGKRLAAEGHEVTFVVGGFADASPQVERDGYKIIRLGNRYSVYWRAFRYIRKHLADWPDIVIEEVNTMPFFSRFYLKQPQFLFFHMLCREIWFYQIVFPISLAGYLLEPLYLRLLSSGRAITVSESTRRDLRRNNFSKRDIDIISEGFHLAPANDLQTIKKFAEPTVLSLGAIRSMKRTLHQIKAFELAKQTLPELQLKIAGSSDDRYGKKVLDYIARSPYAGDIEYLGRVTEQQKRKLMQRSHVITVTSVKEGWGLIVTEAGSQGTPAVVYDVDGLRDSVQHNKTGLITSPTPEALADGIIHLLRDQSTYERLQQAAWNWSKQITFDQAYQDFKEVVLA